MWLPEKSTDRPDPESRKSRSQGCVSGHRGAAHWYQTPLHFYLQTPIAQIYDYSMAQFEHWTKETFSANFRKMLTLEQYRDPRMANLYQRYLAKGPVSYMEPIFEQLTKDSQKARQLVLDFYGPIFLLYSIYDGAEEKESVVDILDRHVDSFSQIFQQKVTAVK